MYHIGDRHHCYDFKVLCECKQFKNPVKRDVVVLLDGKIRSLGAQKGIICSTSGFQKGAIKYAKEHGIALFQIYDKKCIAVSHSGGPNEQEYDDDPIKYIEDRWPKYCVKCFESDRDEAVTIYPTRNMIIDIYRDYYRVMKKVYGIDMHDFDMALNNWN
ncbi:restriction endonuclease [Butyrivibrio sp. INlla14]|uniref:restriction endonuclease n=1 Tax=Butyrivibrio sp. INlla14 TaxID=1520808 RepID=UPI00087734D0|nr:restriction endonuclease [Butyrivibrio sp. INlla14]SCY77596.1 Restriction endonuclease [Butyrivibrio sp. INlla14]